MVFLQVIEETQKEVPPHGDTFKTPACVPYTSLPLTKAGYVEES